MYVLRGTWLVLSDYRASRRCQSHGRVRSPGCFVQRNVARLSSDLDEVDGVVFSHGRWIMQVMLLAFRNDPRAATAIGKLPVTPHPGMFSLACGEVARWNAAPPWRTSQHRRSYGFRSRTSSSQPMRRFLHDGMFFVKRRDFRASPSYEHGYPVRYVAGGRQRSRGADSLSWTILSHL